MWKLHIFSILPAIFQQAEFLVLYVQPQYFKQIWQNIYEFNTSTNHT